MKLVNGLLNYSEEWSEPDIYMFTGNRYITRAGKLVMGRGAALQCRDLFPNVDKEFGDYIKDKRNALFPNYYLLFTKIKDKKYLGAFQVKRHYSDRADLNIIKRSTNMLSNYANTNSNLIFHMNYPGVGYGGLSFLEVNQIIEKLPDNVIIYK